MKLVCDTREQRTLKFPKHPQVTGLETRALSFGDYGALDEDGNLLPLVFERKSLGDLFGTLGKGYKRFKKELERAKDEGVALVLIVECPMEDVWTGYEHSSRDGSSVTQQVFTLWARYDVFPVFCTGRRMMARFILESLAAVEREWKNEQ